MKKAFLLLAVICLTANLFSQKTSKLPVSDAIKAMKLVKTDLPSDYPITQIIQIPRHQGHPCSRP
ncbi:MAG: hypothetical protein IAF38_21895 [Bacteroidia bacterium]|nr:hypothetical protein [Bacteroidia bacterium]